MQSQSLNGIWEYRVGKGCFSQKNVPFSALPVGHSECVRNFDLQQQSEKVLLKFDGITYAAKVYLNDTYIGDMLPYCEYSFDVTACVRPTNNRLLVELEDIAPKFGPSEGWENFGGIIRDVSVLYAKENYITDVFFHADLTNTYQDAVFTVETQACLARGVFDVKLFDGDTLVLLYAQAVGEEYTQATLKNVKLWFPDTPHLYRLEVSLLENGETVDTYSQNVGFREFTCDRHRFLLNGEPLFIKGVCKHEMFGNSGHCPTEQQMRRDMQMIKDTGCNFVRLVHYPHSKRILEIADELGLMVSEEPGLWWSDTANPAVSSASLEVLRRTILRDRNHPSIVFWLSFNECRFTEQFLIDSANVCRTNDPTRMVSGANCMNNEDTLKYYALCGFDFYTMHPYSNTMERAKESARILHDKPLLFTEWGGYYVYDNPKLLSEFMAEMYELYLANADEGALAGALFWEWSELNDFNRNDGACIDGMLYEGLVDVNRNPNLIYAAFRDSLKKMGEKRADDYWFDAQGAVINGENVLPNGELEKLQDVLHEIKEMEGSTLKMRKRCLKNGPVLKFADTLNAVPLVLRDNDSVSVACDFKVDTISLIGMTSLLKGYPLGGDYGEPAFEMTVIYADGSTQKTVFCNGVDITTTFLLSGSSMINPIAENARRMANFGYDKNFEQYLLNVTDVMVDNGKAISSITLRSLNTGYAVLLYGILRG